MSEWWTYRLSDFLMFSPATYWRLVERYNREVWPLQALMLGAGVLLLWLAARRPAQRRVAAIALAGAWLWVGWAFHWRRYAAINWAAEYLAAAFALQAALLLAAGLASSAAGHTPLPNALVRRIGLVLAATGVLLYPAVGAWAGRAWTHAEMFGIMPEPTALATLGLLLAGRWPHRTWLGVIPIASLITGLATLSLLSR